MVLGKGMLVVKTQALEELATNQEDAADAFKKATSATDGSDGKGVMYDLRTTHGAISVSFIHKVNDTLTERGDAGAALEQASTLAAAALRAAKTAYEGTDKEAGEVLDKEMRDR